MTNNSDLSPSCEHKRIGIIGIGKYDDDEERMQEYCKLCGEWID